MAYLQCYNCGSHDHFESDCKMPKHPSKEARKRAEFVAEDLVDACERFQALTESEWIDREASEYHARIALFVKYVRTGEGVLP